MRKRKIGQESMRYAVVGLVGLLMLTSQGVADTGHMPRPAWPAATASPRVELSVAAAAELDPAMREVARAFEQKFGTSIRLTFADSGTLYSQIRGGAAFDAFF